MKMHVRLFCVFAALLFAHPAFAQWQVPDRAVPIGRGGAAQGFKNALPGAAGRVLTDNGPSADPSFKAPSAIMVPSIVALKAVDTTLYTYVFMSAPGRAGNFVWTPGNFATRISLDTNNGVYVKADAISATSGAWVRQFDGVNFRTAWFGIPADYSTDSTTAINNMFVVANSQNLSAVDGQQSAVYINVDGGVRFRSQNLQWLPTATYIYVYVRYFANSDLTKGVNTGGLGTNEYMEISVNSGWPLNPFGSYVGAWLYQAQVHPAIVANNIKNADNSLAAHMITGQAPQPSAQQAALASFIIMDEGLNRFRITYGQYASNDPLNGTFLIAENRTTDLTCSGCNSATWGAEVPAVGAVVRGVTSLSRYVVTGSQLDILHTDWLSGTAVPGEFLMNERALIAGSISGTTLTVTTMLQGSGNIANGHALSGMFFNNGITPGTTIIGQSSGTPGGVGVYVVNNSQNVALTNIAVGNVAANVIQGGGVTNVDHIYTPVQFTQHGHAVITAGLFVNTPPCAAGTVGALSTVTDSNTATWGAVIAAGGANKVLAFCNGTSWTVAGK